MHRCGFALNVVSQTFCHKECQTNYISFQCLCLEFYLISYVLCSDF